MVTVSRAKSIFKSMYVGLVAQVHTTGAPVNGGYSASQITYDVWVNMDTGPVLITGVTPANDRYPNTVNVIPARVTSPVHVMCVGAQMLFHINELLDLGSCTP